MTEGIRDGTLTLTWPWRRGVTDGIAATMSVGMGSLFVMFTSGLLIPGLARSTELGTLLILGLVILAFLGIGGFFAFWGVRQLTNKTELAVGEGAIVVRDFPLTWGEAKRLSIAEIEWLCLEEYKIRSSDGDEHVFHRIQVGLRSGEPFKLLDGLTTERAQAIKAWLGQTMHPTPMRTSAATA